MNEMIQESILERIDAIDDVVLESEANVLISLADVYLKSVMIQESVEDPEVAYSIMEAADLTDGSEGEKKPSLGERFKNSKPGQLLKTIWTAICNFFRAIKNKIVGFFSKFSKDNIAKLKRFNNSEVVNACKKAGFKVERNDDDTWTALIPWFDFEALIDAVDSYEQYATMVEDCVEKLNNRREKESLDVLRKIMRIMNDPAKKMSKALEKTSFVKAGEFEANTRKASFAFDNAIKNAERIKKMCAGLKESADSAAEGEGYDDLKKSDNSSVLNTMVQLSKSILQDLTEANNKQTARIEELRKKTDEMWKEVDTRVDTAEEKFYAKNKGMKNMDKRAQFRDQIKADQDKLTADNA